MYISMNDCRIKQETLSIQDLASTENISIAAARWRIDYDIKSVEDCVCVSEEASGGFVSIANMVDMSSHLSDKDRIAGILEAHDECIFIGFRNNKGKSFLLQTNNVSSYMVNN